MGCAGRRGEVTSRVPRGRRHPMPAARWPSSRLLDLLEIDVPIVQAPMAGAQGSALASAVSAAGGLGSLPCAMLNVEDARAEVGRPRAATNRGFQLNFFCHTPPQANPESERRWRERLAEYYAELGVDHPRAGATAFGLRAPFDAAFCELVEEIRPKAASFHFGPPRDELL